MPLQSENVLVFPDAISVSRDAQQVALLSDTLRLAGTVRLKVQGTSMLPALWPGDVLTVEANCKSVMPGDIVVVYRDGRLFVHRAVAQRGSCWIIRGDAMPQNDPPVESQDVLGKVVRVQREQREWSPAKLSVIDRYIGRVFARNNRLKSVALSWRSAANTARNRVRKIAPEFS